jgi:hypothetical protein
MSSSPGPTSSSRHRKKRDRGGNPPSSSSSDNGIVEDSSDSNFESDALTDTGTKERQQQGPHGGDRPTKEMLLRHNQHKSLKFREYESELSELQKEANEARTENIPETNKTLREKFGGCYNFCWDSFPRCFAITFRVIVPLLLLIGCAFIGGWVLARFEAPDEFAVNDDIMAARKVVDAIDWNAFVDLPLTCLDVGIANSLPNLDNINRTVADIADLVTEFLQDVRDEVTECALSANLVGKYIIKDVSLDVGLALVFSSPTFNWIRWYVFTNCRCFRYICLVSLTP